MTEFDDIPDNEDDIEPISKTQLKREMTALQELGSELVDLPEKLLETIPLEGKLRDAIYECRHIKHREGRRRQMQYIGKLMRAADCEPIKVAYEKVLARGRESAQRHHLVERWRDRMLNGDAAVVEEFLSTYEQADRQQLRQLIRTAQKEQSQQKPPAAARKLFKYLREFIDDSP